MIPCFSLFSVMNFECQATSHHPWAQLFHHSGARLSFRSCPCVPERKKPFQGRCKWSRFMMKIWLVLSDEQMSTGWSFSLLNDEQMSNQVRVEHQPEIYRVTFKITEIFVPFVVAWGLNDAEDVIAWWGKYLFSNLFLKERLCDSWSKPWA